MLSVITLYFNVIFVADEINLYKYECIIIIAIRIAKILIYTNNN